MLGALAQAAAWPDRLRKCLKKARSGRRRAMDSAWLVARLRAMNRTSCLAAVAAALALVTPAAAQPAAQPAATLANTHPAGLDLAGMDRNIKPGDDFFAYANGGWMARTAI